MRCGAYLRSLPDVDPARVALAGLCQGGQDAWLGRRPRRRVRGPGPVLLGVDLRDPLRGDGLLPGERRLLAVPVRHSRRVRHRPPPRGHRAPAADGPHEPPRQLVARERHGRRGDPDPEGLPLYGAEDRVDFRAEVHEHDITGPFVDALEAFLVSTSRDRRQRCCANSAQELVAAAALPRKRPARPTVAELIASRRDRTARPAEADRRPRVPNAELRCAAGRARSARLVKLLFHRFIPNNHP